MGGLGAREKATRNPPMMSRNVISYAKKHGETTTKIHMHHLREHNKAKQKEVGIAARNPNPITYYFSANENDTQRM